MESYNMKIYYYETGIQYRIYKNPIITNRKSDDIQVDFLPKKKEKKHKRLYYNPFYDDYIEMEEMKDINRTLQVSLNRSKQNLIGICRANRWDYFITFTFNPKLVNSKNYEEVCIKAGQYMHNLKRRDCPNLIYVLVPELHKKDGKYHLHGLIGNTEGLSLKVSGRFDKKGHILYNISSWKYGWNTASAVQHNDKVSNYISKYITKDTEGLLHGRRRYWASHNCILREEVCDTLCVEKPMSVIEFLAKNNSIKHMKSIYVPQTSNNIYYIET